MCNAICEIIATAINTQPPYSPYVTACYRSRPWIIATIEHERALTAFDEKMKNSRSAQLLSMQQFLLYKWRFVIAADLCNAWKEFGGIVSQINLIGVLTNMSIAGNPFIAMKYDEALNSKLATFSRERTHGIDYQSLLPNEDFELKRAIIVANPIAQGPRQSLNDEVPVPDNTVVERKGDKRFQKRK